VIAPAEQPPVEITGEMVEAFKVVCDEVFCSERHPPECCIRAGLAAAAPLIAAQVRAEVAEQIAQEIEEAAAEVPTLMCAWTANEAVDIARSCATTDHTT
jgi:hypothetical protein